jgi:hypothetical protein
MKLTKTIAGAVAIFLIAVFLPSATASEPLTITAGRMRPDKTFELSVKGEPNAWFYVEVSWDLLIWGVLEEPSGIEGGGLLVRFYTLNSKGTATVIDPLASVYGTRFYRLQAYKQPNLGQ